MFKESSPDRFPEAFASFDLYNYNFSKLLKRFYIKRSRDKSRKRRSGALLVKFIIEEKSYKEITNIE
jgi:hypothetical protein